MLLGFYLSRVLSAFIALFLIVAVTPVPNLAQAAKKDAVFRKVKLVVNENGKFRHRSVRLTFGPEMLSIEGKKGLTKAIRYEDIVSAEYSYSKSPRWKTGLGLSAAAVLLPPLWLVTIPIGFTKHRRHWLTIRTEEDFAVLKLRKGNRKILIPTFETRSGVAVTALGEDK